jgi:hypothetical protein
MWRSMLGVSHVILHLGLCNTVMKLPPQTQVAAHIRLVDRIGGFHNEQTLRFARNYESTGIVEFEAPQGEYQLQVSVPQYNCYAADYLYILPEHDRTINEQLSDGPPAPTEPFLLEGTAPASFLYVAPTYVLFDKSTQCNKPVGDPIPAHIVVENDQDSFYIWMYSDPTLVARGPEIVAMQLQTPTGENHYIRLKVPFPLPWGGFPSALKFNVTENDVDWLATQPTDVLLCPKLFETSVG